MTVEVAEALLRNGGLVAFPTETVYGLGADATSPHAVSRIYAAKGRPRFNPLIAHVAEAAHAFAQGTFTAEARGVPVLDWLFARKWLPRGRGNGGKEERKSLLF